MFLAIILHDAFIFAHYLPISRLSQDSVRQWQGGVDGLRGRPYLQALPLEASAWFSWWLGGKEKPAVQKGPEDSNLTRGLLSILTDVPSIDRYFSFSFAPVPRWLLLPVPLLPAPAAPVQHPWREG